MRIRGDEPVIEEDSSFAYYELYVNTISFNFSQTCLSLYLTNNFLFPFKVNY